MPKSCSWWFRLNSQPKFSLIMRDTISTPRSPVRAALLYVGKPLLMIFLPAFHCLSNGTRLTIPPSLFGRPGLVVCWIFVFCYHLERSRCFCHSPFLFFATILIVCANL